MEKFNVGAVRFGLWSDHVNSWMDNWDLIDRDLLIKYEDIQENPLESLKRIIKFIGLPVDEEKIRSAVEASRFDKMQTLERQQSNQVNFLAKSDTKLNFVRSGKSAQWKNFFTEEMINSFLDIHGQALARLNYM